MKRALPFGTLALAALCLACTAFALLARPAMAFDDNLAIWDFRYAKCVDATVGKLVGQDKFAALKKVRGMNLMTVRILHPRTTVNYEVVPQRLTMVIAEDGIVTRAFCR